jgi:mRNA-degrading endonuclease RelE of RelBE toxin-antitoxin system
MASCFAYKASKGLSQLTKTRVTESAIMIEPDTDDIYRVTKEFCLSEDSLYEFQSSKTRIIALFADNNSTALINKFKKEIYENKKKKNI